MEGITIFLIALSLAMDAFAVSIANGITCFSKKNALKQGIYFGSFQFLMPLFGWFLGINIKSYMEAIDHWIAFALLALIGGGMIIDSFQKKEQKRALTNKDFLLQVHIMEASAIIGIVAFFLSYIGGVLGKHLGRFLEKKASIAGGFLLIAIGVKILLEHIFF